MRIILDCDPGNGVPATDVDDGLAIGLALAEPHVTLEAITIVAGNTDRDTGYSVARTMLDTVRSDVPVYAGAAAGLQEPADTWARRRSAKLNDPGVATIWADVPGPAAHDAGHDWSAAAQIASRVANSPGAITLVAIGPLTNVAHAMQLHPGLARDVHRIVIMGGGFDVPGHLQELNFAVDPEAAHTVLSSGAPITLVPLDVTMQTTLVQSDVDRLATGGTALSTYLADTTRPWIEYCELARDLPGCRLHDPLAVALLADPHIARTEPWSVDVELAGLTRSRPVRWRADELRFADGLHVPDLAPIDVAVDVDNGRLVRYLLSTLSSPS